jgi:hypothetical protein
MLLFTGFVQNPAMFLRNPSMASNVSSVLADRGSHWSSSKQGAESGEGPLLITFINEWKKRDDPPFEWHARQPHTRFKSIQHRRSRDSPFFHEFLILKLDDGSVCRLERTGEGSQLDAIRRIGSRAHDIIERITDQGYELELEKGSDIVSRIELPREFDLIDVLAICYAIQKSKHSSKYTLQRYNCYFFCCTILAILTRRLLTWESIFTDEIWESALESALDELSHRSRAPLSADTKRYVMPRLCATFDPENAQPTQFLLDAMRHCLGDVDNGAPEALNKACAQVLWGSELGAVVSKALEEKVKETAQEALDDEDICPPGLHDAFNAEKDSDWDEPVCALLAVTYSRKILQAILNHVDKTRVGISRMGKILVDEYVESWSEYYMRYCQGIWKFLSSEIWELLKGISNSDSDSDSDSDSGHASGNESSTLTSKLELITRCCIGIWMLLSMDISRLLLDGIQVNVVAARNDYLSLRNIYLAIKAFYRSFLVKIELIKVGILMITFSHVSECYGFDLDDIEELSVVSRLGFAQVDTFMEGIMRVVAGDALVLTLDAVQKTGSLGPIAWPAVRELAYIIDVDDDDDGGGEILGEWWWTFSEGSLQRSVLKVLYNQPQTGVLAGNFNLSVSCGYRFQHHLIQTSSCVLECVYRTFELAKHSVFQPPSSIFKRRFSHVLQHMLIELLQPG